MKEELDFAEMEELMDALDRVSNKVHKEVYDEDDLSLEEIEDAIGDVENNSIIEEIVGRYELNDIIEYIEDDISDTNDLYDKLSVLLSYTEDKEGYHDLISKVDCLDIIVRGV